MRKVLGVIAGLVVATIVIFIAQMGMMLIVAMPSPEMMQNPAALRAWVSGMPLSARV